MSKCVYVEGNDILTEEMFTKEGWKIVDEACDADLICFTGGSDVSPMLYDMVKEQGTFVDLKRDEECCQIFNTYVGTVPMVGICRGGQFLNVMCGGELAQDIDGHHGPHDMWNPETGQIIECTSDHHQMMVPTEEAEVLFIADLTTKIKPSVGYQNKFPEFDTEVVVYEDYDVLCYQPHPEWVDNKHECCVLFFKLIDDLIKGAE